MLHELSISSLGVIAGARVALGEGLTVVTGETGAGKTMILTGLNLILGGKPTPDAVRTGAAEASAEAVSIFRRVPRRGRSPSRRAPRSTRTAP